MLLTSYEDIAPTLDPKIGHMIDNGACMFAMAALGIVSVVAVYAEKRSYRMSKFRGQNWVKELCTRHEVIIDQNFKMTMTVFDTLWHVLASDYGLEATQHVALQESVGMFLYSLAKAKSSKDMQERFQYSGETIHRHFYSVLDAVIRMSDYYIVQSDLRQINPKSLGTPFENAIGAIDDTHVPCVIPTHKQILYIGQKGTTTQNVMAV